MSRRSLSFGTMKNSRSRQNSPSRSGSFSLQIFHLYSAVLALLLYQFHKFQL
jgi:hypothetical protein